LADGAHGEVGEFGLGVVVLGGETATSDGLKPIPSQSTRTPPLAYRLRHRPMLQILILHLKLLPLIPIHLKQHRHRFPLLRRQAHLRLRKHVHLLRAQNLSVQNPPHSRIILKKRRAFRIRVTRAFILILGLLIYLQLRPIGLFTGGVAFHVLCLDHGVLL